MGTAISIIKNTAIVLSFLSFAVGLSFGERAYEALSLYMTDLSILKERWKLAVELAVEGKYDEALKLLSSPVPERLAEGWSRLNDISFTP